MLTTFALIAAALLALYWLQNRVWEDRRYSRLVLLILPFMLLLLVVVGQTDHQPGGADTPVVLAIAADVSLSMGTMPEPTRNANVGTRLQRAQEVLLPLLAELAAQGNPPMVSVTAFTSRSETILAWDDDLSLAREIVQYVLSTGLLTEAGSDIGVALNGALPLFESLPEAIRDQDHGKFLLVVSDGEQTKSDNNSAIAIARLQDLGVKIIALQVGSEDLQEGLPVYDDSDEFIGFETVGGQIFSVPDPEIMALLAGDDPSNGLSVRADTGSAHRAILEYIGRQPPSALTRTGYIATVLVLWSLLLLGLSRLL